MNDSHLRLEHSFTKGVPERSCKIGMEDEYHMPVKDCGSQQRVPLRPQKARDESEDSRSRVCSSSRSNCSLSISDHEMLAKDHKQKKRRQPVKRAAYKSNEKKEESSFDLCLKNRSNSSISISDLSDDFDEDDDDWSSGIEDEVFDQERDLAQYVVSTLLKTSRMNHNSFDFSLKHRKDSLLSERGALHPRSSQRTRRSRCDRQEEESKRQLNKPNKSQNPKCDGSSIQVRKRSTSECPRDKEPSKVVNKSSELASIIKESTSQVEGMLSLLLQRQAVIQNKGNNLQSNSRHSI